MLATASSVGNSVYTVIWVFIGIVTLLGSAGLLGVYKWAKRQGVRDSQIDHLIEMDIAKRFDAQDRKLDQIQREATPNGGNSTRLGDTVKRTEGKVDGIVTTLDRHIGQSDEVHSEMRRRIGALEKRSS